MDTAPLAGPTSGLATFDYRAMADDVAEEARAIVARFRDRQRAYVIETGRDLLAVKDRLEHGLFVKWVEGEMNITIRTAQNAMRVASELGAESEFVSHLPPTVLYQLAAPSTPGSFRQEIVERIKSGEVLRPRVIGGLITEAQKKARDERVDATRTPEEQRRQAKLKRDKETRRQRIIEESRREQEERTARRKAVADELAEILVIALNEDDLRKVYKLIHDVDTFAMRTALAEACGSAFEERSEGAVLEPVDA